MRTWSIKTFMSYNALVVECRTIVGEERVIVAPAHDNRGKGGLEEGGFDARSER